MIIIIIFQLSIDYIFSNNLDYGIIKMFEGNAIFIKFWQLDSSILDLVPYKTSFLPGIEEGISGSIVVGYNIGIDMNIKKEKIDAAITALKYISLREAQIQCNFIN